MTDRAVRDAEIIAMVQERPDLSLATIGGLYGLTRERVRQIVSRQDWPRRRPSYSPEVCQQIIDLHHRGLGLAHIAHDIGGVSPARVAAFLSREGLYVPKKAPPKVTAAERRVVERLYGQPGVSARDIAKRLGRTRNEIIGIAYRMGLAKSSAGKSEALRARNQHIKASRAAGATYREIAGAHDISVVTVGHIVNGYGHYGGVKMTRADRIRQLAAHGIFTAHEIAAEVGCDVRSVWVQLATDKRPGYKAAWMANKRATDPEYRQRERERQREYARRKNGCVRRNVSKYDRVKLEMQS